MARPRVPAHSGGEPPGGRRTVPGPPGQIARARRGGAGLAAKRLLNLNELGAREELLPALTPFFPKSRERDAAARDIYYLTGSLSNVGGIAHKKLLTGEQFRQLKPLLVVRRPAQFQRAFYLWCGIFFGAFWLVHIFWSLRGFQGDQMFLPALLALSGIGLILMVSLRDPVRDNLLFVDFAQGAAAGAVLLAVLSGFNYERLTGKLSFVPLLASFALSVLLVLFGSGPGTSDAKVNLFGFQPVEIIRVLLVFFLAGYFARCWDVLRHARENRPTLAALTSRFDIPPVEYTLPVLVSVALSPGVLLSAKGHGPGAGLRLPVSDALRNRARQRLRAAGRPGAARRGLRRRLPARRAAHRGRARLHVAFPLGQPGARRRSTGALAVGLRHRRNRRHRHRAGRSAIRARRAYRPDPLRARRAVGLARRRGGLRAVRVPGLPQFPHRPARALRLRILPGRGHRRRHGAADPADRRRIARRAAALRRGHPVPQLRPHRDAGQLRDVRHPAVGRRRARAATARATEPFRLPLTAAGVFFAIAAAVIVAKAAYIEVLRSGPTIGAGTLVVQADGGRRYQYNPRLQEIMREIPKGTIYDRNGLPLATSNWSELEKHRADYQALGIDIDRACPRTEARHYPFGGLMFDLLGDLRTRTRWGATNTSFVERDSARRLRGYDDRPTLVEVKNPSTGKMDRVLRYDYRELVPLLRHRREPNHPEVRRVLDRPRDVRMSIDARFEVKVAEILRNQLKQSGQTKGAAVVMDPATGDLLAAVSFPLPVEGDVQDEANPYLDRARYGLYPPGSTFKVVTAMAALRKDAQLAHKTYQCERLPDGRVGAFLKGSKRPIRDDVQDKNAARHARSGARPRRLLQRLLRAVGRLRCGRRRAARYGHAARHRRRIAGYRGGVEESAAAIGLRTGRGGGIAVPDGARGRHRRQ